MNFPVHNLSKTSPGQKIFSYGTQTFLHIIGAVPGLIRGVLELAVCKGDVDFIKYLVIKQGVDVNGEFL